MTGRARRVPRGRRLLSAGVAVAIVAVTAACLDEEPTPDAGPGERGSWTVLAYSIADTDLEPYLLEDVDEMGEVGTQDGLTIVTLLDRADGYSDDPVLGMDDWVGGRLIEVVPGGGEVVEDLGDVNTGDPQVLADFVAHGIGTYPADNYALVISDHGASWPGVGGDESNDHDTLTLAEIRDGIAAGLEGTGVERLDLLGFDACLMATYEVAAAMTPVADLMLASQELEPGHGWDYTALAAAADGASPVELGEALIDGFAAQAKDWGTDTAITLSLVDLTLVPAVEEALDAFSGALVAQADGVSATVGRTLAQTLGFGRSPDPDEDSFMTDLAILAGEIGVDSLPVSDEADALVRAVNDAVLARVDGQATRGATGLSIYFPPRVEHYDETYQGIGVAEGWAQFLRTYYGVGAAIPQEARAAFGGDDAEVWFDDDGLNIATFLDEAAADNVAEAFIRYGVVEDDGTTTYRGQEQAAIDEDGSVLGVFDLTTLVMTDGEDSAPAYIELTSDDDWEVGTIDVPMAYYAPGEDDDPADVLLSIVVDGDSGDLLSETYYLHNGTQYGAFTADPEGIIVPEVLVADADGGQEWVGTSDVGLWADLPGLGYEWVDLPSGTTLVIELWVVDFGGHEDVVSAVVTVP